MKLLNILIKNFKLLFRSKSSAFVITIGPLIIIALVALAFSNSAGYDLTIGMITPDQSELSQQFTNQLKEDNYTLIDFTDLTECLQQIKTKTINICIELPKNFTLGNTNEIEFHVDQSRLNLVESVISSISSTINIQADEISKSLTNNLLDTIEYTNTKVITDDEDIDDLSQKADSIQTSTKTIKDKSENSKIGDLSSDFSSSAKYVQSISTSSDYIKDEINNLLIDLDILLDLLEASNTYTVETNNVRTHYNIVNTNVTKEISKIQTDLVSLEDVIDNVKAKIDNVNSDMSTIEKSANVVDTNIKEIKSKADKISVDLAEIKNKINKIKVTSAENIVNPTTIKINPLISNSNRSTYLFPYFIILIILFVGIMLSSTLVVMEKKSRSFFRTFTTPTKEYYHILARYLTNIIILIVQLVLVFIAAYFYLEINLLTNYLVILLILFLSITFFIFLGQFLGYLFKTQEGVTIASISLGSLFLFLSNIILPIESFPQIVRKILIFNPYLLCSELLKKAIIFQSSLKMLQNEILLLLIYIILTIILTIIFQKVSFGRFFQGLSKRKILLRPHITKENYFCLNKGEILKNKRDLLHALNNLSEEEFKKYVNKKNNEFAVWIKDAFKERKLARKIKKAKTQEKIIIILKENIKKSYEQKEKVQNKTKKKNKEKRKKYKDNNNERKKKIERTSNVDFP